MATRPRNLDMEALRQRAWETTVPADGDDDAAAAARIAWLKQVSPDDWHRFVLGFNWGDALAPLSWIVRQDDCDLATALEIFWRSEPGWDLMLLARGETPSDREEAGIIAFIAHRITAKGYARSEIAWAPEPGHLQDYEEMKGHLALIASPPWPLSQSLIRPVAGRVVVDSAEAWAARPEGVRTGFWLEWPEEGAVTTNMARAADKLHDALFYSLVMGGGLGLVASFSGHPGRYVLQIAALLGVMG